MEIKLGKDTVFVAQKNLRQLVETQWGQELWFEDFIVSSCLEKKILVLHGPFLWPDYVR